MSQVKLEGIASEESQDHESPHASPVITHIAPVLEQIEQQYDTRKLELCADVSALTLEECAELTSLVRAEGTYTSLRYQLELLAVHPNDAERADDFFFLLEQYIGAAMPLWRRNADVEEAVCEYFEQLMMELRRMYELSIEQMFTVREWPDCPVEGMFGSLMEVSDFDCRLHQLRRLRLLERLTECFHVNSLGIGQAPEWLQFDERVQYYNDVLHQEGIEC